MIDLDENVALTGVKNVVAGEEVSQLQAGMEDRFWFLEKTEFGSDLLTCVR